MESQTEINEERKRVLEKLRQLAPDVMKLVAAKGDTVIILSYRHVEDEEARHLIPRVVLVDAQNRIVETKREVEAVPF